MCVGITEGGIVVIDVICHGLCVSIISRRVIYLFLVG